VDVFGYQHGIYPRSEAVVAATRDLERGRTTQESVDQAFAADRAAFARLQSDAGLDFFSDGLLRWADLFRPLAEAGSGLSVDGLVRWFDNNSFYRAPHLDGPPVLTETPPVFDDVLLVPEPRVATLPSPYLLSRVVHGAGDAMVELAEAVLEPAAQALRARGCRLFHLEEPWLGFHGIDRSQWEEFEKAIGAVTGGLDVPVVLHVYYGDGSSALDRLRRFPVAAVGVDLVETDVASLGTKWETGLLAGCLNGRTTILEDPGATAALVVRAAGATGAAAVYCSTNSEIELLPLAVAERKVRLLADVCARVKGALS